MQGIVESDEDPILYYDSEKITSFDLQVFIRMATIKEWIMHVWIMVPFPYSSKNHFQILCMYVWGYSMCLF